MKDYCNKLECGNSTTTLSALEMAVSLFNQLKSAKSLVDDGKEVKCSSQLQGAKTRCLSLINVLKYIAERDNNNVMVSQSVSQDISEE